MCLILFSWKLHPDYPLIVAANRDENYQRPTSPAHIWGDYPGILAGRDLEKGGTWMGISKTGRFAALTNYRNSAEVMKERSRGELPLQFLAGDETPHHFMETISSQGDEYPGYNLLAGTKEELYYHSNVSNAVLKIEPGIHGLSNGLLDSEWPKVAWGKMELGRLLAKKKLNQEHLVEELFGILRHEERAPDHDLPYTGVPLEMERILSPLFIKTEGYGTRCSTILLYGKEHILFAERTYFQGEDFEDRFFSLPFTEAGRR